MASSRLAAQRIFLFGPFELSEHEAELRKNGVRIKLQEQPFHVLVELLTHAGRVVTREELQQKLWPADTFVDFDVGLNTAIRKIRQALGDDADKPRYIETVAKRGYRFLEPVTSPAAADESVVEQAAPVAEARYRSWRWIAGTAVVLAAILIVVLMTRRSPAHRIASQRRLTANPAEDPVLGSAISPDGKYLAFADPTGFYLRNVATGETHPLALPKGFNAKPAAWFPDATHLVAVLDHVPNAPPSLWDIPALGGNPRKLRDAGVRPAVSPDGTQIAFVTREFGEQEDLHREYQFFLNADYGNVWVMKADGESARQLTKEANFFGTPAWSPDGKHIAVSQGNLHPGAEGIDTHLLMMDPVTSNSQVILAAAGLGQSLAWTRDGRLVYSLQEQQPNQNDSNLWALQLDNRTVQPVGSAVRLTSDMGTVGNISVSADGQKIAFLKLTLQPDVYVAELLDHGSRLSVPKRLTLDERQDFPFGWTPDSKSVIFVSDRDGVFHIFEQAIDQPEPELLVGGDEPLMVSRLSADGSSIHYLVNPKLGDASTTVRLMSKSLAGGPPQFILQANAVNNQQCAQFPATRCVLSQIVGNRLKLFPYDQVKGIGTEIPNTWVEGEANQFNWSLSPDGNTLVFPRKVGPSGQVDLRYLSIVGGAERSVPVRGMAVCGGVDWAADGKSVWVTGRDFNDVYVLMRVSVRGNAQTMLEEKDMILGWVIPSPDGQRLALWKASGSANVWMLENF